MDLNQFYITGINYKKSDASVRGEFAVSSEKYAAILETAAACGLQEVFILSTCNRTEIYGIAHSAHDLVKLICKQTPGSTEIFHGMSYIKQGMEAVEHLFSVAAGLDSQILGDYEIVGQLKHAAKFARERGFIDTFLERLLNCVLQSSKEIKNHTQLSGGTVSVSFAAVRFLKEHVEDIQNKRIVLLGAGKIGRNTCKNLVDYSGAKNIILINRSDEKAAELAKELGLRAALYNESKTEIQEADIVIVATNADEPVIKKSDLLNNGKKVLVDLSIPRNIEPAAGELENITLVNVDDLSKINDSTLEQRLLEVPKAKNIIAAYMHDFTDWHTMRKNVPVLKAVKQKLTDMQRCNLYLSAHPSAAETNIPQNSHFVQRAITNMAVKMRSQNQPGCNFIEAINDFISCSIN